MSKKQEIYKKKLIKLAHTLKHSHPAFCDEDTRRYILEQRYGVRSFKDLTISELEEVIDLLRSDGTSEMPEKKITKRQAQFIKTIWRKYAREKEYASLLRFVGRITGVIPIRLEILTKEQASMVIAGLRNMFKLEG